MLLLSRKDIQTDVYAYMSHTEADLQCGCGSQFLYMGVRYPFRVPMMPVVVVVAVVMTMMMKSLEEVVFYLPWASMRPIRAEHR